jgi:FkbM family methyltransferase
MLLSRFKYYLTSLPTILKGIRNWPLMLALLVGLPPQGDKVIMLRGSGLRYRVRTAMDVWVIKEICLDHDYERACVPLKDGWTIIDIGAGLGDFAIEAAARLPNCRIYAFEPFSESFGLLTDNLRMNAITNVRAFQVAVSDEPGAATLRGHRFQPVLSATIPSPHPANLEPIQVPSMTLDQVLREHQLDVCDFLKIDCEGCEGAILHGSSDESLARIRNICLEYHDYLSPMPHAELADFLRRRDFQVTIHPNKVHRGLGLLSATRS